MANNYIDDTGIHTQNITEIVEEITEGYKNIYGQDINVSSDTPDGQRINIEAQAKADVLDFATQVYNSFDVDAVGGVAQDRLYKINNVYRKSAKYSYVQVNVTATQTVNLQGLDISEAAAYTVSDTTGNQFYLVDSATLDEGTTLLEFRAKDLGAVEVTPNTITNMVTIVAGISSVSNPTMQYITGTNEESDADFRIRRNKSTAISGKGFYDSLEGDLLSIPLVTVAKVYENDSDETDANGIPPHSIWCIVEGGVNANIGAVIYANKTFGAGQKGSIEVQVPKADGTIFTAKFDRPQAQPLYIKFSLKSKTEHLADLNYIKKALIATIQPTVYESIAASQIIAAMNEIDTDVYLTTCKVSTDGTTWEDYVTPSAKNNFFTLSEDNINITELL